MRPNRTFLILFCGAVTCCISFEQYVRADNSGARPERSTIERGLNFLQQDAVKWRQEKNCSTCHHGTMTMWVQLEAKSRGFAVAPDELEENIRWAKERIMERADLPRDTRAGWSMVNTPAIYLAIMAHAVPRQDAISADDLKRVSGHLLRHQEENGAWMWSSAPPKNIPPPFFEPDGVKNAVAFLVRTQRDDGSWPMTKRTHPGETPTQNVIPITYFGSAWGTLSLLRCVPCESVRDRVAIAFAAVCA
jgi:hypothetical protein